MKILIVDDRRENLLALEAVLESPDYHLVFASSGEEALKCLLKDDFAVILMDVQMPEMDGFETAKLIRARKRHEDIPIIFITAIYHSKENIIQGYSLGAIDYLFKPFNPEMLRFKIEAFAKMHFHKNQIRLQNELLKQRAIELETLNEDLKRTTSDLRKAEALARVIGDTSIDTVITIDALGQIINSNPVITAMFGYEQVELQSRHVSMLFTGDSDSYQKIKNELIMSKSIKIPDEMAMHRNGSIFPVEIQIGATSLEEQQILVCSIRDISERKQLEKERRDRFATLEKVVRERTDELFQTNAKLIEEILERKKISEELRKTGAKLSNILESITDVFFTLDNQWQFIFVNAEAEKYWLKERETLIGQNIWEVFPEPHPKVQPFFEKAMHTKEAVHFEIKERYSDAPYEVHVYPSEEGLSVYYHDISKRKMFEKEMARLDRLNLVGQMAAGIGHEVRNPMTTVRGFLQLLGGKEECLQFKDYFELMIQELDRANSIITDFLSLAKTKTIDLKPLSLNRLIENLYPLIQADALVSEKEIKMELQDIELLFLDEKEICQLILNLVRNGMEAMSSRRSLTIRTFMDNEEIVLAVRDEGSGIKDGNLEKLGTPFFTTKENGTGLGLATCYSIVARHNAKMEIDTGPEGTTFFVRFMLRK